MLKAATSLSALLAFGLVAGAAHAQTDTEAPETPAMGTEAGTTSDAMSGGESTSPGSDTAAGGEATTASGTMSAEDEEARTRAQQSAEAAGMSDVLVLDRAFVLQGTTAEGETVFMIVNPPGALIGVGGPVPGAGEGADGSAASGGASTGTGTSTSSDATSGGGSSDATSGGSSDATDADSEESGTSN